MVMRPLAELVELNLKELQLSIQVNTVVKSSFQRNIKIMEMANTAEMATFGRLLVI